jgi:hypothetical protein
VRVQLIGTGNREAEIGSGGAAGQLLSWPADGANPALTENQTWLWTLTAVGRLGALAASAAGAAALRAEVATAWQADRTQTGGETGQ